MAFDPDAFFYLEKQGLPYALAKEVGSSFFMRGSDPSKWPKIKPALATKVWCNGSRISKEKALAIAAELAAPESESEQVIEVCREQNTPGKDENCSVAETIFEDTVNALHDIPANLLGDDSPLPDAWEEIKDQVQNEPSYAWGIYVETMEGIIEGNVEDLPEEDREALANELGVSKEEPEGLCEILLELLLKRAVDEKIRYEPFHFTYFYYLDDFTVYCEILKRTGLYECWVKGYSVAEPDGEEGEMSTEDMEDTMSAEEFAQARKMNWPEDWEEAKAGLSDDSELEAEDDEPFNEETLMDQGKADEVKILTLEKAISLAVEGHKGQEDKAGAPYILHPLRIMFKMDTEEKMIAAVMHDLIEDTETSLDDLKDYGLDTGILEAIDSVTRREDEEYEEFIDRAGLHPMGADIKMADIEDNMDLSRIAHIGENDVKGLKKYHRALARIKELQAIRKKLMVTRYYKKGGNVEVGTVTLVPRGLPHTYSLNAYGSAGTIVVDFAGALATAVMPENFLDLRSILETGDPFLLYSYFDLWAPFFCPECGECYTDKEWDIQMNGFGYCPQGHRRKLEER